MGEDFKNSIGDIMPLQQWVSLFKYFKRLATTKITIESGTI